MHELQKGIEFCSNCQTNYKAADLIILGYETLQSLVQKFNKKMTSSTALTDHAKPIVEENENEINALDVDIAEAVGKAHDNWFETDNLDDMFAAQIRIDNK